MIRPNGNNGEESFIETWSGKSTRWIGSKTSLIFHTIVFIVFFSLGLKGFDWDKILLILTTIVSLEAIYLSIFIQMTINRNTQSLEEVEEDLGEIQENIDEIQEDVDEISSETEEEPIDHDATLQRIEESLQKLLIDLESLKQKKDL